MEYITTYFNNSRRRVLNYFLIITSSLILNACNNTNEYSLISNTKEENTISNKLLDRSYVGKNPHPPTPKQTITTLKNKYRKVLKTHIVNKPNNKSIITYYDDNTIDATIHRLEYNPNTIPENETSSRITTPLTFLLDTPQKIKDYPYQKIIQTPRYL